MTISAPTQPSVSWRMFAALVTLFSPRRLGLLLWVVLPTVVALLYYGLIAADRYVATSAFTVRNEQSAGALLMGAEIGLGSLGFGSGNNDQLAVNTYIRSHAILAPLEEKIGLRALFRSDKADGWSRLAENATQEELLAYYRERVNIVYDERARITTLSVAAFTPEQAQQLNAAILEAAEQYVNQLAIAMQEDSIAFARREVKDAEAELLESSRELNRFRQQQGDFDPAKRGEGIAGIVQQLEGAIAAKRAQLEAARGTMTAQNPYIRNLTREIAALERQTARYGDKLLTTDPDTNVARLDEYSGLVLLQEFATKRYQLALSALETTQAEASRKHVYLNPVVPPNLPQEATEPKRLYTIFSVFFLSFAAYTLLLLLAASVHDHIRK